MRLPVPCAIVLAACAGAPAGETPEQAHAALAAAVADPELRGTFEALDLSSRWAVMSIHRCEREMHDIVRTRYPEPARGREMARTRDAAESDTPAEYFVRRYRARLTALRPALATPPRFERDGTTASTPGPGGTRLTFSRGDDGRWGWSDLRGELEAGKDWSFNALETVRDSAARAPR